MIPKRSRFTLTGMAPYLALLAMVVVASATSEHFFQIRNLLNITRQVSYTGIIALGMTFVIIAGGIDLSVGSAVAFIGGVIIMALNHCFTDLVPGSQGAAFFFALFCGLAVGFVGGVLSGWLATVFNIAPFIATLGFMGIYRSLALYTGDGGEFRVLGEIKSFSAFGTGMIAGVPIPSVIFILLAVLFGVVLNWTRFGRYVCAVGSNEKVALSSTEVKEREELYFYTLLGIHGIS